MMNMRFKEEPSISHLQLSSDEFSYEQISQSSSVGSEVSDGDALEKNFSLCRKAPTQMKCLFVPLLMNYTNFDYISFELYKF